MNVKPPQTGLLPSKAHDSTGVQLLSSVRNWTETLSNSPISLNPDQIKLLGEASKATTLFVKIESLSILLSVCPLYDVWRQYFLTIKN